ncbi:hypothetical protein K3757_17005 [Sulfitobacter sp. S223]|uniref:hypothetical protein n=1 Tax=Sulfitobacter sp. S223 TaxID=2867023 RepID=UPI0021A33929|nr:hypothetical protein [Sulfitobacter sp. S223]UWR26116.1 hypothetical protein K3757_17005 [Sulfitobacter sp. S223]
MTDTPDVAQLLANARAVADNPDAEIAEIEAMVIETVSAFEARLQHHFARGPFFVKLRNKLAAEGHTALAQTVYHYYLAANVLKHGGGKSLRELEKIEPAPFTLQDEEGKALVDVTADGFLSGLIDALGKSSNALAAK